MILDSGLLYWANLYRQFLAVAVINLHKNTEPYIQIRLDIGLFAVYHSICKIPTYNLSVTVICDSFKAAKSWRYTYRVVQKYQPLLSIIIKSY